MNSKYPFKIENAM